MLDMREIDLHQNKYDFFYFLKKKNRQSEDSFQQKLFLKDVGALLNEYRMSEERYHKLNSQKLISLAFQKRAQDEIKLYTSKATNDKSFRYI